MMISNPCHNEQNARNYLFFSYPYNQKHNLRDEGMPNLLQDLAKLPLQKGIDHIDTLYFCNLALSF